MKTKFTFLKAIIIIAISGFSIVASAQAPAPLPSPTPTPGPSVSTTTPGATPVSHYICAGANVSLISPTPGVSQYVWWKQNSAGNWVVVGATNSPTNTYNEASTTSGYYIYKVQTVNANGCESLVSTPINIFALPPITPLINGPTTVCQSIPGNPVSFTLTASVQNDPGGYTYTYQWTRNGVDILGATSSTYTPNPPESTPGTVIYGVRIGYSQTVYGTDANCVFISAPYPVTVTPLPATPTIQWN